MTPSGMEAPMFRFVERCLNQLRHHVPPITYTKTVILTVLYHTTYDDEGISPKDDHLMLETF